MATWNSLLRIWYCGTGDHASRPAGCFPGCAAARLVEPVAQERLTYSAFALPGIVIALALVFFGADHAP